MLDYAERLAPCGLLASRRAIEPAVLADVLPSIFLIDVEAGGRPPPVGDSSARRCAPFLDGSPRGRAIDSVGPPGFRVLLAGAVRMIARDRCPIALDGLAGTGGPQERRLRFDLALVRLRTTAGGSMRRWAPWCGDHCWQPRPIPSARPPPHRTPPAALAGAMAEDGAGG